jgi:hypothetical protein
MLTTMRRIQSALHLVLNVTAACHYRAEARLPAPHRQSICKLLYHGFVHHSDIKQTYQSSHPFLQDRASYCIFEQGRQTYDVAISDMSVEFGCPGTHPTHLSSITFLRLGSFVSTPFSACLSKEFNTLTISHSFVSQNFTITSLTFHFYIHSYFTDTKQFKKYDSVRFLCFVEGAS